MDTNRTILKICLASLALFASAAGAQTIYKQVDADGRVMFTDRPRPDARVVTSYETSRPATRQESDTEAAAEPVRRAAIAEDTRPLAQSTPAVPEFRAAAESRPLPEIRTVQDFRGVPTGVAEAPVTTVPRVAPVRAIPVNDVERAVATYTPLASPLAMEKDAVEAARRARADVQKAAPSAILVVKAVPREGEPVPQYEGISTFYVLWASTFFLLAAGLLYFGWQVIRLILRGGFPRWQLGIG